MADKLTGFFGSGVRRDRKIDVITFAERDFPVIAVNARTGREDEFLNVVFPGRLEQDHSPVDINIVIEHRISDGRANAGTGGQMNDYIKRIIDDIIHRAAVADISFDELEVPVLQRICYVTAFNLGVVKGIEIIDSDDVAVLSK